MAHWVRNTLRRFGFVCTVVLALLVVMPTAQIQAETPSEVCAVQGVFALSVAAVSPDVCPIDGCRDCGLTCADGCCHAPVVAPPVGDMSAASYAVYARPAGWADVLGAPFGQLSGLKRPPRG